MTDHENTELPAPTGLDYHEAYRAMYPGLAEGGTKLQTLNDQALRTVDRAARLRRAERERVKAEFLKMADQLEAAETLADAAVIVRKMTEEIR